MPCFPPMAHIERERVELYLFKNIAQLTSLKAIFKKKILVNIKKEKYEN